MESILIQGEIKAMVQMKTNHYESQFLSEMLWGLYSEDWQQDPMLSLTEAMSFLMKTFNFLKTTNARQHIVTIKLDQEVVNNFDQFISYWTKWNYIDYCTWLFLPS